MSVRAVILDLDGTLYRGHAEVPGATAFVAWARRAGIRPLFVTNRANRSPARICEQLRGYGMACEPDEVLTTSEATALYLKPAAAYVIGEEYLVQTLTGAGFRIDEASPDYVIVSFDRQFTYEKLRRASQLISAGARYIATNADRALKMDDGVVPGTGALVAAVTAASSTEPTVIGKPEAAIVEMALRRLAMKAADVVMVGDNVETDVLAGQRAGLRTALILTGISTRADGEKALSRPTWIIDGFEQLRHALEGAA